MSFSQKCDQSYVRSVFLTTFLLSTVPLQTAMAETVTYKCTGAVKSITGTPFGLNPVIGALVKADISYESNHPADSDDGITASYSLLPNGRMIILVAGVTVRSQGNNHFEVKNDAPTDPVDNFHGDFSPILLDGLTQVEGSFISFDFNSPLSTVLTNNALPATLNLAGFSERLGRIYDASSEGDLRFSIDSCAPPTPASLSDYFPANPGSKWVYRVVSDPSISSTLEVSFKQPRINDVTTSVFTSSFSNSNSKLKFTYSSDQDGIQLHRVGTNRLYVPGYGIFNASLIASPPITLATNHLDLEVPSSFHSEGKMVGTAPGIGTAKFDYKANFNFEGFEIVTVPAGTFRAIKLHGFIDVDELTLFIEQILYLTHRGIVKQVLSLAEVNIITELQETNWFDHDFAITDIKVPKRIKFTDDKHRVTTTIKVSIQNRSPQLETIDSLEKLKNLVALQVESLSLCPDPQATLVTESIQKRMPIKLKPKQRLTIDYQVTFECVNDAGQSTPTHPGHEDYRYRAAVDHRALDNLPDVHIGDDVCPRTATELNYDEFPNGSIKEKGCGAKKKDGSLGADVVTDLIFQ